MPERKADGTKTAQSVRAIEISAPPTSSIVRWAASLGDMPSRMLRSTFSTTTIASSTTMPTASTKPNKDKLLSDIPKAEDREGPDQGDRDRDDRNDRRSPALQEQKHDAHHQKDC